METEFKDPDLERLESDPTFTAGKSPALVKAFRKKMNLIRQATNRQDLYAFKSLRLEKLKGDKQDQHSLRLNDQFRLIVEFREEGSKEKIEIIKIEDYH